MKAKAATAWTVYAAGEVTSHDGAFERPAPQRHVPPSKCWKAGKQRGREEGYMYQYMVDLKEGWLIPL